MSKKHDNMAKHFNNVCYIYVPHVVVDVGGPLSEPLAPLLGGLHVHGHEGVGPEGAVADGLRPLLGLPPLPARGRRPDGQDEAVRLRPEQLLDGRVKCLSKITLLQ